MEIHSDERGTLYEIPACEGTQFVSHSYPGVRRGDHYHRSKTEWFTVIQGTARLYTRDRIRNNGMDAPISRDLWVGGQNRIEILPNTTHAVENVGDSILILFVQSDKIFCQEASDTYPEKV